MSTARRILGNEVTPTGLGGYSVSINGHAYEIQKDGSSWHTIERLASDLCRTVRRTGTLRDAMMLLAHDHFEAESTKPSEGYNAGQWLGRSMAKARAGGDYSFDPRWDLVDAAKRGADYLSDFERGLTDALTSPVSAELER